MAGIYFFFFITVTATVISAWPGEKEIYPVPQECPEEDSKDFTVHLAHNDCTKFCKCSLGKAYVMDCPDAGNGAKLHFNKVLQVCDWPKHAKCDGKGTTSGQCTGGGGNGDDKTTVKPTSKPIPEPTPEPTCDEGVTYPHECSCEKYYKCENGNMVLQKCSKGDHYSKKKKRCTRSSRAGCIKSDKKKFF